MNAEGTCFFPPLPDLFLPPPPSPKDKRGSFLPIRDGTINGPFFSPLLWYPSFRVSPPPPLSLRASQNITLSLPFLFCSAFDRSGDQGPPPFPHPHTLCSAKLRPFFSSGTGSYAALLFFSSLRWCLFPLPPAVSLDGFLHMSKRTPPTRAGDGGSFLFTSPFFPVIPHCSAFFFSLGLRQNFELAAPFPQQPLRHLTLTRRRPPFLFLSPPSGLFSLSHRPINAVSFAFLFPHDHGTNECGV